MMQEREDENEDGEFPRPALYAWLMAGFWFVLIFGPMALWTFYPMFQ